MKLSDLVLRAIENAPRSDQLPNTPAAIYKAMRKLVALHFWVTRPVPYYNAEFYRTHGR